MSLDTLGTYALYGAGALAVTETVGVTNVLGGSGESDADEPTSGFQMPNINLPGFDLDFSSPAESVGSATGDIPRGFFDGLTGGFGDGTLSEGSILTQEPQIVPTTQPTDEPQPTGGFVDRVLAPTDDYDGSQQSRTGQEAESLGGSIAEVPTGLVGGIYGRAWDIGTERAQADRERLGSIFGRDELGVSDFVGSAGIGLASSGASAVDRVVSGSDPESTTDEDVSRAAQVSDVSFDEPETSSSSSSSSSSSRSRSSSSSSSISSFQSDLMDPSTSSNDAVTNVLDTGSSSSSSSSRSGSTTVSVSEDRQSERDSTPSVSDISGPIEL